MNVKIVAKKCKADDAFTEYAEKKLKKFDKLLGDSTAKIVISPIKDKITLELTIAHSSLFFRAEHTAVEKNEAIDACIDKIAAQIRKNKTKVERSLRSGSVSEAFGETETPGTEEKDYNIIKHKQFVLHPMSADEAILQMNLLSHSFFMFRNGDTGEINVVYKRSDGNYAVLEARKD
jgi:putative sigma-54 modulation protein